MGPTVPRRSLLCALTLVTGIVMAFGLRQNTAPVIGGPISLPKLLWLNYALLAWFVIPAFLWRHDAVAPALRRVFGAHLLSMAARGLIELWMLYVTISWDPLYGITHDLWQIGLIAVLRRSARRRLGPHPDHFNQRARRFCTLLQASLAAEIIFAALFYRTGAHRQAVYFASTASPYGFINGLTVLVDVLVYTALASFLWRERATLFRRPVAA